MTSLPSPETMRKRFHTLSAQADKIRGKSGPLRDRHDAMIRRHAKENEKLAAEIRKAEKGLYEIDMERAALARALGGQTGKPE